MANCLRKDITSELIRAAGSAIQPEERMRLVLDKVRELSGVESVSVVIKQAMCHEPKVWSSSANSRGTDSQHSSTSSSNLAPQVDLHSCDQELTVPLNVSNGYSASLIFRGVSAQTSESIIDEEIKGILSMLVESVCLKSAESEAHDLANRRFEEIAAIYEIGEAVDYADPKLVLDLIVRKAASVMNAQTCSLMLLDERDGCLVIEASYGLAPDIVKGTRIKFGEGIVGQVAASGEPVLITDVATDRRFKRKVIPRPNVSGSMCVPLKNRDGIVKGVLSIRRHHPNPPFTQNDLKLFCIFAIHAALAIENAELYARLHQKIHEISTVSSVLQAINSTLDLNQVLEKIVQGIKDVVGFDRCCLYLLDPRTGDLVAGAREGYFVQGGIAERVKLGEGVIGLAARERIPIFSREVDSSACVCQELATSTTQSVFEYLAVPIVVRDNCIGVVVVDNRTSNRPIRDANIEMLAAFVNQAGIAVENARLYEAMEQKYAEMNALYEHSRAISAAYGVQNAAEVLVSTAKRMLGCDGAALLLLDSKRQGLALFSVFGLLQTVESRVREFCRDPISVEAIRHLTTPIVLDRRSSTSAIEDTQVGWDVFVPENSRALLVPLVTEDATIGVLILADRENAEFRGTDIKLVTILTSHAATVLKNAIAYEERMQQRVFELTTLYEFSRQISSASSLEEALDSILSVVAETVACDELSVYAIDYERNVAAVRAHRSRSEQSSLPPEEPLDGNGVVSWVIRERKALLSPDVTGDPRLADLVAGRPNVRSLMAIPLIVHDEVVGVLTVCSDNPGQYSEEQVRVLSVIASQGAAIYKELEALSTLTNYTDNILSSVAAGIVTLDTDGVVLTWNNAAERIVGLSASRVVGSDFRDVLRRLDIPQAEKRSIEDSIEEVYRTGQTYHGYKLCFHPHERPEIFLNMSISLLRNSAGDNLGLVLIFEDISREIRLEEEFRRMRELAAIGQLAASIAHELRNPLSSIKGAAQFLQKEYEDHASIAEFLSIIIEEVNGLSRLTTEFLEFARPLRLDLKPIDLNKLIEKTLQLMNVHIADCRVSVNRNLDPSLPIVEADAKQLKQVLKNIIINALQAMPDGGNLTVETGSAAGGWVYFSVSDTGIGIPPDKIDRIFQPFVTTKTKGTGLGLSVVQKIVDNHGGRVEVVSEPGKGSTFKVILPRVAVQPSLVDETDLTLERRNSGQLPTS